MNIRIQTQDAQIGIQHKMSQLHMKQPKAMVDIEIEESMLYMKQKHAKVLIDQRQCFSEAGLKSTKELMDLFSKKSKQENLQAIARISREGKELADVHQGMAIAKQAKRRGIRKVRPLGFDMVPKSRPKIHVEEGKVYVDLKKGHVHVKNNSERLHIRYQKGDLKIYLKQKNAINIQYVGKNIDVNL